MVSFVYEQFEHCHYIYENTACGKYAIIRFLQLRYTIRSPIGQVFPNFCMEIDITNYANYYKLFLLLYRLYLNYYRL